MVLVQGPALTLKIYGQFQSISIIFRFFSSGNTRGPIPRFNKDKSPVVNYTDPALCAKMGLPASCHPGAPSPVCGAGHKATNCDAATR